MEIIGQIYRFGIWSVKPGKEPDFIAAWDQSSEWLAERLPDAARSSWRIAMTRAGSFLLRL